MGCAGSSPSANESAQGKTKGEVKGTSNSRVVSLTTVETIDIMNGAGSPISSLYIITMA